MDYDYNIAFVTDYMIADEDSQALQGYFEANAEDLNGDGEVHVQIQNYVLPPDDAQGYDPQMLAAGQTKMTVDMQEGTSMIFFISQQNFEKFKDAGVSRKNWRTLPRWKTVPPMKRLAGLPLSRICMSPCAAGRD